MFSIERDVYFWLMDCYHEFLAKAEADGLKDDSEWENILNRKKAELLAIEKKIFAKIFSNQSVIFAEVTVSDQEIASFWEDAKSDPYFQEDSDLFLAYRYHLEIRQIASQAATRALGN